VVVMPICFVLAHSRFGAMTREIVIPGQRPIRSGSLAQSAAAGQVREIANTETGQRPNRSCVMINSMAGPLALDSISDGSDSWAGAALWPRLWEWLGRWPEIAVR
jgi:hypothetical protein